MAAKKYLVTLTPEQRERLDIVARSYRHSARERQRAQILLLADTNREGGSLNDAQIAQSVGCQPLTVSKVRARATTRGVLETLTHKEQQNRKGRRLDGAGEAHLVAIACSQTPDGKKRWTMKMLKDRLIELGIVESIDEATICRTLKKMNSSPG
jgi:hypothetical protein